MTNRNVVGRPRSGRPPRVHVYGAAGHNLGDDAIALVAHRELRAKMPTADVRIASIAKAGFAERYGLPGIAVDRRSPLGMVALFNSIRRADAVVIGGGTLIQDKLGLTRLRGMLAYVRQVTTLAKAFRKPVGTLAIGVDELTSELGRRYAAQVLSHLDLLVVRDERSLQLANEYAGGRLGRAVVAADPAYLFEAALAENGLAGSKREQGRYVVLSLVNEDLQFEAAMDGLAATLRKLLRHEEIDEVVLLTMDRRPTEERRIYDRLLERHGDLAGRVAVFVPGDAEDADHAVTNARLVIAMRLHAMIFALGRAPLLGISRTTKTATFLGDAGVASVEFATLGSEDLLTTAIGVMADKKAVMRQSEFRDRQQRLAAEGLEILADSLLVHLTHDRKVA